MHIKHIVPSAIRRFFGHSKQKTSDNINYNKSLWNSYAQRWSKETAWVEKEGVQDKESYLEFLGDEWGTKEDVLTIIDEFIKPYVSSHSHALEIGVGGGRIADKVAPLVKTLDVSDIAITMLENAKKALSMHTNITYFPLNGTSLHLWEDASIDFVYSFDVFVHLDLHTMWRYFQEISRILKPNALAFIHTTNLLAPKGWQRFESQRAFKVEGHYFVTPEIISTLCNHCNLEIIKESQTSEQNFYYARDYLFIVRKKEQ